MLLTKLMTAEELWATAADNMRHELVNGRLTTFPYEGLAHGLANSRISFAIGDFVRRNKLGVCVAAGTGFILHRNPDTVRAPDFAFVSKCRVLPNGLSEEYFEAAPDLVVEVLSENDTDMEMKIAQYFDAGCRLLIAIDPSEKTIRVHYSTKNFTTLSKLDNLSAEPVFPDFSCSVAEIF